MARVCPGIVVVVVVVAVVYDLTWTLQSAYNQLTVVAVHGNLAAEMLEQVVHCAGG